MKLNGETKTLKDPVALSDFLTQESFQIRESQWKEMEKSFLREYANVILSDSDTALEIMAFVGGG